MNSPVTCPFCPLDPSRIIAANESRSGVIGLGSDSQDLKIPEGVVMDRVESDRGVSVMDGFRVYSFAREQNISILLIQLS